jgi:hypothetical protein
MPAASPKQIPRARALPATLPLFPLPGALLLPGGQLPLNIFEPRYLRMVDEALGGPRLIGMIQPRDGGSEGTPTLYAVGCAGRITQFAETDDGRYLITLTGRRRFRIEEELTVATPYRQARVEWKSIERDDREDPSSALVDRERLTEAMRAYLDQEGLKTDWDAVRTAPTDALIASLAMGCPFAPNEKQALLEAETAQARAECLIALMEMSAANESGAGPMLQ